MKLLTLVLGFGGGRFARCDLLRRPLVDGAQGRFVQTAGALVPRQPAAADEHCRWLDFILSRAAIGSGCWCVSLDLSWRVRRDVAHPSRRSEPDRRHRRPVMHLSPDDIIFWQYGFLKLNATIVFTWGLMLVLAVGSKLITRKLSTESATFPLAESSGNRRHRHRETNRGSRPEPAGEVSRLSGHALPVCRHRQPLHHHSRLRAADRLALDHGGARAVRVRGRAALRHRGAGAGRLPQILLQPTFIMLPFNIISELSRTLALAVRLFGNMMSGTMIHRHSAHHHALHLSDRHDGARSAHRHGASLHLQHSGRGLYRGRHARSQAQA